MSFLGKYQNLFDRSVKAAVSAMEREVAEEVRDIMEEQTEYEVYSYDASPMAMATRRVDQGGLGDPQFMISDVIRLASLPITQNQAELELTIENTAPFQGTPVDYTTLNDVVERGTDGFQQPEPRPFVAGTQEDAISSGRARKALMEGLKRQGF